MCEEKLALEHVTKQFGQKTNLVTALEDVSLAFKAGEVSLIIGTGISQYQTLRWKTLFLSNQTDIQHITSQT